MRNRVVGRHIDQQRLVLFDALENLCALLAVDPDYLHDVCCSDICDVLSWELNRSDVLHVDASWQAMDGYGPFHFL